MDGLLKFDDQKCTLTKVSKHADSAIEAGDSVTGIFVAYTDKLGVRGSIVKPDGKLRITSDIKDVRDETENSVVFETQTSVYLLERVQDVQS